MKIGRNVLDTENFIEFVEAAIPQERLNSERRENSSQQIKDGSMKMGAVF